jgi:hypothetical protein
MDLEETTFVGVDWIRVVHDRNQCETEVLNQSTHLFKKCLTFCVIPEFVTV